MAVYKGREAEPRMVECRAVGCEGDSLDHTLKELNADGWNIRQIFQESYPVRMEGERPAFYRIFAQRESRVPTPGVEG
jgi:hypothetical protein